jgi:hypothetical protein
MVNASVRKSSHESWRDVPAWAWERWVDIYSTSREGINLSTPCPVCGVRALHLWYWAADPTDQTINGRRYVAKGSIWQWCSHCRSYNHGKALVPDWWRSNLRVDSKLLMHEPEILNEIVQAHNEGENSDET